MTTTVVLYQGRSCKRGHEGIRYISNATCVECSLIIQHRWKREHRGETNATARKAYKKAYKTDPDRFRRRQAFRYQNNPQPYKDARKRRRARQMEAEGSHTAGDVARIRTKQRGLCACGCGVSLDVSCTEDHIIPLSRGGSDWASNIQLMTSWCNDSKGTKLMSEWVR